MKSDARSLLISPLALVSVLFGACLRKNSRLITFALFVVGLAPMWAPRAVAAVKPDNKWRIECNHSSDADGVIVFRVTPEGGTAVELRVEIKKGTGENAVARQIRDVFRGSPLNKQLFSVETDDGEDVLVKKNYDKPNFGLELVSNGVKGLSIKVKPD